MLSRIKFTGLVYIWLLVLGVEAPLAVPANPDVKVEVLQPDGISALVLKPAGDEFTGRLETADGYTVVKAEDGWYRYAEVNAEGKLVSSDVSAHNEETRSAEEEDYLSTVEKHLSNEATIIGSGPRRADPASVQTSTAGGASGDYQLLVILIQYPDESYTYQPSAFDSLMNQSGFEYFGSFRDYYQEVSYGQLSVQSTITDWYTAAHNKVYYGYGDGSNMQAAHELVVEAVLAADADGVDFSIYDNDGDGDVDGLCVAHVGPGAEEGDLDYPWSYAGFLETYDLDMEIDGKTINDFILTPEKKGSGARISIGVYCHEFGHKLGWQHLGMDTGDWCLMVLGTWNGPLGYEGTCPAHPCAFWKQRSGWLNPSQLMFDTLLVDIPDVETTPSGFRLWENGTSGPEYFLVEFRNLVGFDRYLPGCGLAIWHVDERYIDDYPNRHLLADIEERDPMPGWHPTDVWLDAEFGPLTSPNSHDNAGEPTGVEIRVLSTGCSTDTLLVDLLVGCPDDADTDADGTIDCADNCPNEHNPDQIDTDGDGIGDVCDDSDGDGLVDASDNCMMIYNPGQADWNDNGLGDACEDSDGDTVMDDIDNCRDVANSDQADQDGNGVGDACCCGLYTIGISGNANCSEDGKLTLSDISKLIDRVYISKERLCCEANGNTNGSDDCKITLSDISVLIDAVFISKSAPADCIPGCW